MKIDLEKIDNKDKSVLNNMFQLYLHDITASLPMDLNEHGLFEYNEIDFYFNGDENHHAFFVKVDGKYAGFVLIDDNFMVLKKEKGNYDFSEMFILNAYKNKGIGKEIAIKIFDMFRGNWEVKPVPRSDGAKRFWEKIIKEYTNNKFETKFPKPNRATFIFNNEKI